LLPLSPSPVRQALTATTRAAKTSSTARAALQEPTARLARALLFLARPAPTARSDQRPHALSLEAPTATKALVSSRLRALSTIAALGEQRSLRSALGELSALQVARSAIFALRAATCATTPPTRPWTAAYLAQQGRTQRSRTRSAAGASQAICATGRLAESSRPAWPCTAVSCARKAITVLRAPVLPPPAPRGPT